MEDDEQGGTLGEGVVELARGVDAESVGDAVLLLSALGIPHAIVPREEDVALVVPTEHEARARRELEGLAAEDADVAAPPALRGGARAGLPTALALLVSHALLMRLPAAVYARVLAAGELDATRVDQGEIYRVVTALTLHADFAHVLGNAVATAIFVSAAGDWIGPGFALACTLLAGALGNLGAALMDPGHRAIGFSTATFGALGLTAVFGFVARYRDRIERQRAWLALGAGLALLALLGAGERSDLLAHMLGLGMGALVGLLVSGRLRSGGARAHAVELGPLGQVACAAITVAGVAGAWIAALAVR